MTKIEIDGIKITRSTAQRWQRGGGGELMFSPYRGSGWKNRSGVGTNAVFCSRRRGALRSEILWLKGGIQIQEVKIWWGVQLGDYSLVHCLDH